MTGKIGFNQLRNGQIFKADCLGAVLKCIFRLIIGLLNFQNRFVDCALGNDKRMRLELSDYLLHITLIKINHNRCEGSLINHIKVYEIIPEYLLNPFRLIFS